MSTKAIWTTVIIAAIVVAIAVFFYIQQYNNELKTEEQSLKDLELEAHEIGGMPRLDLP